MCAVLESDLVSLNVRPETIKLLEENVGKTLSDINHSRILYDPPPRILEIKAKINKWDLIKIKSFCTINSTFKALFTDCDHSRKTRVNPHQKSNSGLGLKPAV